MHSKEATSYQVKRNGRKIDQEPTTPASDVNYSVFGAKEIRDILKSKAHCLRSGFSSNHMIIKTFNEIRKHYILRVGLPTYLSQMLGEVGKVEVRYCILYSENGRPITLHLNGNHNQSVQRYIARQFHPDNLPAIVEAPKKSNPKQMEARYL
jgi:hypothetical protein